VGELVAVSCSHIRVLISNRRVMGPCGRFYGFAIVLEVTVGNIIVVFSLVRNLKKFVVKTSCRAFGETPG
jgi:hypothetical protein